MAILETDRVGLQQGSEERSEERAAVAPAPGPEMLLRLQRSAGNQAVARMLLQRQAAPEEEGLAEEEDAEEEELPLGPEDALEGPVVPGEGEELGGAAPPRKPQFEPPAADKNVLARKVDMWDAGASSWREMPRPEREAFSRARYRGRRRSLAFRIMADMASASDHFRFTTTQELEEELLKRITSSLVMQETQEHVKVGEGTQQAFGYPFSGNALLYGPRVNYSARAYWVPSPPDTYARRTDSAKNRRLRSLPRHERHTVYGDQGASYKWELTDAGKRDPYNALMKLFVPQPPHRRSLLHCDYLISLVHFRSFAATLGQAEFNRRVNQYGPEKMVLRYDLFTELQTDPSVVGPPGPLASLQLVRPADEFDFVVGDHVYFFNHAAYDPLNKAVGNAWRLENALLVDRLGGSNDDRTKGTDIFLGHGSGRKTLHQMKAKLAEEYNDVVAMAQPLAARADRGDPSASTELSTRFPNLHKVGAEWRVQGTGLAGAVDIELRRIQPDEVIGPHDPKSPGQMYPVRRPMQSA
jgi:hypothetical protein